MPVWLQAAEKAHNPENSWLVLPFKCADCAQKHGNSAASIIRDRLNSHEGFLQAAENARGSDPCATPECASRQGKAAGAGYVVFGTVQTGTRTVTTGEKESRYLYRKQEVTYYVLSVGVANAESDKPLYSFRKNTRSTEGIRSLARQSAGEIVEKFEGLMPAPEEKKEEQPRTSATPLVSCPGISLAGSTMVPAGSFNDMAGTGFGVVMGTCLDIPSVSFIKWHADLGLYALDPKQDSVQSLYALQGMLYAGYGFTLPAGFALTPEAGAGVLVHAVNGDNDGKDAAGKYSYTTEYFTDFAAGAGVRIQYGLAGSLQLFLRPGYTMFFEKNNTGQFYTVEAGIKWNFM